VTTREHHAQLAVLNLAIQKEVSEGLLAIDAPLLVSHELRCQSVRHVPPADDVEGFVSGDAIHPPRRVSGNTLQFPGFQRLKDSGLDHILDQIEVVKPEHSGQE
jgi:hypothetical protein